MALALLMLAWPLAPRTQTGDDDAARNAAQARKALDAMVQALGGQPWLNMKNQVREGTLPRSSTAFPTPERPNISSSTSGPTMTA